MRHVTAVLTLLLTVCHLLLLVVSKVLLLLHHRQLLLVLRRDLVLLLQHCHVLHALLLATQALAALPVRWRGWWWRWRLARTTITLRVRRPPALRSPLIVRRAHRVP